MKIFAANDPLVLNGTYDWEGYKPGERSRIAKAKAFQFRLEAAEMAKKKSEKKAAAPKKKTVLKAAKPRAKKPKAQPLPGMEDRALQPLEDIAEEYASIRDQRIVLNKEEADLKAQAIKLMHKFGKTIYKRNGVTIMLIAGDEDVKVKVKKEKDGEDEDAVDETSESVEMTSDEAEDSPESVVSDPFGG